MGVGHTPDMSSSPTASSGADSGPAGPAAAPPAVETHGLVKRYGRTLAVDGLDLAVGRGEAFGLLGANGAGKTTAVKMLLGLTMPSAGGGRLLGRPIGEPSARRGVGYLPELFRYPRWLTGREVLALHAQLAGLHRSRWAAEIELALTTVDLVTRADDRVAGYSKGMQQRLGLAVALLGRPPLVILDEPATALDPLGRHELRGIIRGLRELGITVILNSHQLSEVEQVCDRVAILHRGQLLAVGTLTELLSPGGVRLRATNVSAALHERLAAYGELRADGAWLAVAGAAEQSVPELVAALVEGGARVYAVELMQPSLEERFRELVGAA